MAEFKPIESQEEFDKAIQSRLERERKKYDGFISPQELEEKTQGMISNDELERVKNEFIIKEKAYQDKIDELSQTPNELQKKIDELEKSNAAYERASVKNAVAHEMGLPFESIAFLNGNTEEEIRESAETLKKVIGTNKGGSPMFNPDPSGTDTKTDAYRQMLDGFKK